MVPTANVNWYFYWVEVLERSHTTICAAFTTRCVSLRGCRVEFEYEGQLAKAQHALVDFLWTELNVGPALVESAALAKSAGHLDHYAAAKEKALNAAENVRRFIVQVKDNETRAEIAAKLAELDQLISTI